MAEVPILQEHKIGLVPGTAHLRIHAARRRHVLVPCQLLLAVLFAALLGLFGGCAGGGGALKSSPGRAARTPVPISASLQSDFNKALNLMKKGAYGEAIPVLEAILAENNQLPGAQINLAIAYMNLEPKDQDGKRREDNLKKAEQALSRAVEVNPDDAVAHHQLGLLYRKTGRFADARKEYERAISIDSTYAMAHLNLGILCDIYLQQLECAIDHFEKYRALVPEETEKVNLWLSDLRQRAGLPAAMADKPATGEVTP
jgi:tetratricopeptide (TPR) repeat protein